MSVAMPITVITVWRTRKDGHVCPICKALEGYTWTRDVEDPHPKQLVHPIYGPVYDMRPAADCSLIIEEQGHQCRCKLEHQFEVSNIAINDEDNIAEKITKQPIRKEA